MDISREYYFIHMVFKVYGACDIDEIIQYKSPTLYFNALKEKMVKIHDSFHNRQNDAYKRAQHDFFALSYKEKDILKINNKKEKSIIHGRYISSNDKWRVINNRIKDIEEKLKKNTELERAHVKDLIWAFNDFIETINKERIDFELNPLKVFINTDNIKDFAPYFMDFLAKKAQQNDDFLSEFLGSYYKSIHAMSLIVNSESFPESNHQIERFLRWINTYKYFQSLTDQWINFQLN